nr:MetaGeneMark_Unknown Function [uncultured bacterium]
MDLKAEVKDVTLQWSHGSAAVETTEIDMHRNPN